VINFFYKCVELCVKGFVLFIIFTLFLFTFSKVLNVPIYVEPELRTTFVQFMEDADKYKVQPDVFRLITVFKDELSFGTAAYCIPRTNTVVVSKPVFNSLSPEGRKALLYHEWGHCTLKRDHVETVVNLPFATCPASIMYPYIDPVEYCYKNLEDLYIEELFVNPYNFKKISEED